MTSYRTTQHMLRPCARMPSKLRGNSSLHAARQVSGERSLLRRLKKATEPELSAITRRSVWYSCSATSTLDGLPRFL